ncbi:MlaD family protein [Nocardioides daeguensis]|uniref:Mce/MlaD domain-containing protein n=1 Tax=Nocardioides daeguensis TaxID=908359 RepID=A0ABP6UX59_9ACTN|nr:MlaD family protein [Nocardioides daeguensis]MBV6728788.1 MCE family protein [Nocardioides daeguensis]MCR1773602.1 MCE family protein [Nocardioides daeguensis]
MKKVVAPAIAAAVVLAAVGAGKAGGSGSDSVEVVAMFGDASPLQPGNVVKAAGVDVGTIEAIEVVGGKAEVTMRVDRAALPLHSDVTATITTQDLLGERFVALDRGSADAPELSAPMVIPEKQTSRVVDLQDVLNAVDTPTAQGLSALLTESGEALRGHGEKADKALAALAPALRQADDLAAILRDQNDLLGRLVDNAQPVASALATGDGKAMDDLVDSATRLLESLTAERQALRTSLAELPSTLTSARATLAELAGVATPATRTLRTLRPVTGDLEQISKELTRFAAAADPALGSLPPVLKEAERLLDQAAPVVAALRSGGDGLVSSARSADQLSDVALSGKSLTDLMEFAKGWSLATSDYDAISHYFKAMVPLSPNALGDTAAGLLPALPDNILHDLPVPSAPDLQLPGRSDDEVDAGAGDAPEAPPAPDPSGLGGLLSGLLGGKKAQSATGLSSAQEQSLIQQILGGLR